MLLQSLTLFILAMKMSSTTPPPPLISSCVSNIIPSDVQRLLAKLGVNATEVRSSADERMRRGRSTHPLEPQQLQEEGGERSNNTFKRRRRRLFSTTPPPTPSPTACADRGDYCSIFVDDLRLKKNLRQNCQQYFCPRCTSAHACDFTCDYCRGSPEPTVPPTSSPSPLPSRKPTPLPTSQPTAEPTPEPTAQPTPEPTPEPTSEPTPESTPEPTVRPTPVPTPQPTAFPTKEPTPGPTPPPTLRPTSQPTRYPTPACAGRNSTAGLFTLRMEDSGGDGEESWEAWRVIDTERLREEAARIRAWALD